MCGLKLNKYEFFFNHLRLWIAVARQTSNGWKFKSINWNKLTAKHDNSRF